MNHDFDNEFETDDELKRGAAAEKTEGNTLLPDYRQNRQYRKRQPDCKDGSQVREKPLKDHYHFYCGRDHCTGTDRRRLVWKAYDVPDADGYRV
mgnify:CR=1 FL=1